MVSVMTTHPSSMVAHAGGKLCEHLTGTQARYPGIDLVLRSEAKPTFDPQGLSHYVGSPEASSAILNRPTASRAAPNSTLGPGSEAWSRQPRYRHGAFPSR